MHALRFHARWAPPLFLLLVVPLQSAADKLVFSGTHSITFTPNFDVVGGAEKSATNIGVATVNGGVAGSSTLSTLQLTEHFTQLDTAATIAATGLASKIPKIRLDGVRIAPELQGGIFAPILAAVQGGSPLNTSQRTLPLSGTIRLCQTITCTTTSTPVTRPLNGTSASALVGPGVGGTLAVTAPAPGSFTLQLQGAEWTVNTASVQYQTITGTGTAQMTVTQTLTGMGFVQGPASNTGTTLSPTSDPMSGTVQLVTPVQITSDLTAPHQLSGMIVRLQLHFQPEPGRLALLASGALALAALAMYRARA